jgi:DGQHR domain-containing protein
MGRSAGRTVLLGFAPASLLHALSFADVLDQDSGRGYQRRFNAQHSLDFRKYIQRGLSTTIPLTFNLRPDLAERWKVIEKERSNADLQLIANGGKILTQVDCQHRIGHLGDLSVELPFMCFVGLTEREEMEIFNVINSKAKGLSASLLDFHDAQIASDLVGDRPELYVALHLKNEPGSPWYRQLDLGGASSSGMTRRASLRTLQKAIRVFLHKTKILRSQNPDSAARTVLDFWTAVATVLPEQWSMPRKHFLTKGIGVYALMEIAADLYREVPSHRSCDRTYFSASLADFVHDFDWTNEGPLRGLGGEAGVKAAVELIRATRAQVCIKEAAHG